MNYDEYFNNKMNEILKPFDNFPAIRYFIFSYSWDHGHSAGREEMINIAEGLVNNLKDAFIKDKILEG